MVRISWFVSIIALLFITSGANSQTTVEAAYRGTVTDDAVNGLDFFGEEVNVGDPIEVRLTVDPGDLFRDGPFVDGDREESFYFPASGFLTGTFAVDVGAVSLACQVQFILIVDEISSFVIGDGWLAAGAGDDCLAQDISFQMVFLTPTADVFTGTDFYIPDDISVYDFSRLFIRVPDLDPSGQPIRGTTVAGNIEAVGSQLTPEEQLVELINSIADLDLPAGNQDSLSSTIENALERIEKGDIPPALGMLQALILKLKAQRGKKIPEAEADELIAIAEATIAQLEAPVVE